MITADQIMAGALPTSTRVFNIPQVGEMKLHRLPAHDENKARNLFNDKNANPEALEKLAQRNTYYMLYGKFDDKKAAKLPQLMDSMQLAMIHSTGLLFTNLEQENLESLEKNLKSDPS